MQDKFVEAARTMLGFQWADKARGDRVDCVGLLIMSARKAGIVEDTFDINGYGRFSHRMNILIEFRKYLQEIKISEIKSGDIVLIKDDVMPTHCGIVSEKRGQSHLIHSYARARKVVEEPLTLWNDKITHAFRLKEKY